jgi:hypothetical protein
MRNGTGELAHFRMRTIIKMTKIANAEYGTTTPKRNLDVLPALPPK